jgi:hypothetical protein
VTSIERDPRCIGNEIVEQGLGADIVVLRYHPGAPSGRCHEAAGRPRCGGCAATAPKPVRHIASRIVRASGLHAA